MVLSPYCCQSSSKPASSLISKASVLGAAEDMLWPAGRGRVPQAAGRRLTGQTGGGGWALWGPLRTARVGGRLLPLGRAPFLVAQPVPSCQGCKVSVHEAYAGERCCGAPPHPPRLPCSFARLVGLLALSVVSSVLITGPLHLGDPLCLDVCLSGQLHASLWGLPPGSRPSPLGAALPPAPSSLFKSSPVPTLGFGYF